jgi:hypothetical protein
MMPTVVNVAEFTRWPLISSGWLPNSEEKSTRKNTGRKRVKNAAAGFRQNVRLAYCAKRSTSVRSSRIM